MRDWIKFRVIVEVAIRMTGNITKCFQILVLLFAMAESEKVKGYLAMSKFNACVLEECIC